MYTFASEKKKDRPESIVIARVKAIIVTILGINPPLFETDARPFLARSLAYSELKTASQNSNSELKTASKKLDKTTSHH